jgi:hypothetical protein
VFLSLLFPFSVSADYYRYVDENGVPRYVDTMGKVPKVYQDQVVHHILPTSNVKDAVAQKPMGDLLKMELDEEHTALLKEKEELLESIREWEEKYKAWENKKSALDKN